MLNHESRLKQRKVALISPLPSVNLVMKGFEVPAKLDQKVLDNFPFNKNLSYETNETT